VRFSSVRVKQAAIARRSDRAAARANTRAHRPNPTKPTFTGALMLLSLALNSFALNSFALGFPCIEFPSALAFEMTVIP
jgi:hypothetical protein